MSGIDFSSPAFWEDPFPFYNRLREEAPAVWSEPLQLWMVSRFDDVSAMLEDPSLSVAYTDAFYLGLPDEMSRRFESFRRALKTTIVFSDPPEHERMRVLLRKVLTHKTIDRARARAVEVIDDLLAKAVVDGQLDVTRDLAPVLPATVLGEQIGATHPDDASKLIRWSRNMLQFLGRLPSDLECAERALQTFDEARAYLRGLWAEHSVEQENILSPLLVPAGPEDFLTDDELVMTCMALLFAGVEAVGNAISTALVVFSRNPGELERLRRDPSLLPSAIEEVFRHASPVQMTFRLTTKEVELGGQRMRPGQRVALMLAAANRDPSRFPDPDRFDIGRQDRGHVSLGYGRHFCTGAVLARQLVAVAVEALLIRRTITRFETDSIEWLPSLVHRGMKELKVSLAS